MHGLFSELVRVIARFVVLQVCSFKYSVLGYSLGFEITQRLRGLDMTIHSWIGQK